MTTSPENHDARRDLVAFVATLLPLHTGFIADGYALAALYEDHGWQVAQVQTPKSMAGLPEGTVCLESARMMLRPGAKAAVFLACTSEQTVDAYVQLANDEAPYSYDCSRNPDNAEDVVAVTLAARHNAYPSIQPLDDGELATRVERMKAEVQQHPESHDLNLLRVESRGYALGPMPLTHLELQVVLANFDNKTASAKRLEALVIALLRDSGVAVEREEQLLLQRIASDGTKCPINLGNLHGECRLADPADRPRRAKEFADAMMDTLTFEMPQTLDAATPRLRAMITSRIVPHSDRSNRSDRFRSCHPVSIPGLERLAAEPVIDSARAISHLRDQDLVALGINVAQAIALAKVNLRSISGDNWIDNFVEVSAGLFEGRWDDTYDASRLLLPELFEQLPIAGDLVVAVPHRNCLVVCRATDCRALDAMAVILESSLEQPRFISAIPIVIRDSAMTEFFLAGDSQLARRFQALRQRTIARDYGLQTHALVSELARNGTNAFVASFLLAKNSPHVSFTSWAAGITSLLPRTDRIGLVEPDTVTGTLVNHGIARWDQLFGTLGHLMDPVPDVYPPRYKVSVFPSREQLARLELTTADGTPMTVPVREKLSPEILAAARHMADQRRRGQ